jgi:choline-sulfatase
MGNRLRQAGYDTIYGGKSHLPGMTLEEAGFDYFCKDERDGLAKDCAEFLQRERHKPFCLVASFINPHDICCMAIGDAMGAPDGIARFRKEAPLEFQSLDKALARPAGVDEATFFERCCPPLPTNFEPQTDEPEAIRFMMQQRPFRVRARQEWSDRRWREHCWAYARLTEEVDGQIGRVLDSLRRGPHANDTLVVFTSDHGDMDASHRLEHKSTFYDESARVPLIIRPPGAAHPARLDRAHVVSNGLDLLPTMFDYAGIRPNPGSAGRSLRPLLENEHGVPWRPCVPIESAVGRVIVTDRFKYARYDFGHSAEQLIDLVADPDEMRNALSDRQHAEALSALRDLFDQTVGATPRPPEADRVKVCEFA